MPRATVIIPNYNNGRASSRDGTRDFLGKLLESLERTLADDPTELEILIADDGSTDDSLETARAWSPRAGLPMVRLVELAHTGVLSKVLNALHAHSQGEYICRLDGDVVLETPCWVAKCVALLDADPQVAVVTGLQKLPDGRVHALGDATGREVMRAVIEQTQKLDNLSVWPETFTIVLVTHEGRCRGALVWNPRHG